MRSEDASHSMQDMVYKAKTLHIAFCSRVLYTAFRATNKDGNQSKKNTLRMNEQEALRVKYPKFKVPIFNLTLTQCSETILSSGFAIEMLHEPCPSPEAVKTLPYLQDATVVACFLHVRCRK